MDTAQKTRLLIVAPGPQFVRLFLAQQIVMLAAEGFDVSLVCAPAGGEEDELADLPCAVSFRAIAREISIAKDLRALVQMLEMIRRGRPAIVHTHGPKPGLLGAVAALLGGVPVRLHTIHGMRSDGLGGWRRGLVRSMEWLTFACSTRCFAVSRSLQEHVIDEGLAGPLKVDVLRHGSWAGVALDRFNPERHREAAARFRERHQIADDAPLVTYIGRLARDKGLDTLAQAWPCLSRLHPEARLLIAGPLDAADPLAPATLAALRRDASVVLREEFITDVPVLLAASSIFVQPSLREGLGVAALEAAAMELPVVASRVTGLVDTVTDRESGLLFPPRNVSALAYSLRRLLLDPEACVRFGRCGRRLVEERFAQADVLNASLGMYRELLTTELWTAEYGSLWQRYGKRCFDVAAALVLLVLASPLMLIVAVAIWIFLSRPILFTQERAGLHGEPIRIFKFRTMKAPEAGQPMIGTDEVRAHWLGTLLRRLSLDELPQLFNVVRGEMSLIGPRPLLLCYLDRYDERQQHRHDVVPGITGWAQVRGRNAISWEQRFELDLWYVAHRSARLDLNILLLTLGRVLWPQGITPEGKTSMPEFMGAAGRQI